MPVLRYLGLKEETSFNQQAPPAADYHVDIASATLDSPSGKDIIFSGGLGRSARTHRPGFYAPSGNIVYPVDVNTMMDLMKWALGGDSGTYFYGANDNLLPSFCARLGKDEFEHIFSGCTLNSLEIAVDSELAMGTLDILGAQDAKGTITDEADLLLVPEYPLAFHEITLSQTAVDISPIVKSMKLGVANNSSAEAGRGMGSKYPRRIMSGDRVTTIDLDLYFDDMTQWDAYQAATEQEYVINMDGGTDGQIDITLPKGLMTQVQTQASGRDEIVQSVSIECLVGAFTDGVNAVTTDIAVEYTA